MFTQEGQHIITLKTLRNRDKGDSAVEQFNCSCGEGTISTKRAMRAMIMAHRMEVFPLVRQRL